MSVASPVNEYQSIKPRETTTNITNTIYGGQASHAITSNMDGDDNASDMSIWVRQPKTDKVRDVKKDAGVFYVSSKMVTKMFDDISAQ